MFMSQEELSNNLNQLKIGDNVVIIRKSSAKEEYVDYIDGTVKSITNKTLIISFIELSDKRVLKSSILSLVIR